MAYFYCVNPVPTNPTKWSNTLKQIVANLLMNCLSVFDHFVGLALEGLILFCYEKLLLLSFFICYMYLSRVVLVFG